MNLYETCTEADRQHPVFKLLVDEGNEQERALLASWAMGMPDRDGKFVKEFQTTFESSLWELYVHAVLKELGYTVDFRHSSPDFCVVAPSPFVVEATVARPASGEKGPIGLSVDDIPEDFAAFNNDAAVRLCNSVAVKLEKYRSHYSNLPHVQGSPFVLALGSYDRPGSHLAAARPVMAALYGVYHDEKAAIDQALEYVPAYEVTCATKNNGADVPLGLFCDDRCAEISAVVYSCLATWGKLRALGKNPRYEFEFTTLHPNAESINAVVRKHPGHAYSEHLCDGLYVFRNPYAKHPLPTGLFRHPRVALMQGRFGTRLDFECPDDFLLARFVQTRRLLG